MKQITYVLLFFTSIGASFSTCVPNNAYNNHSITSSHVQSINDAPYMAMLRTSTEFSTAVIITKRFLLSGASFFKKHNMKDVNVLTGVNGSQSLSNLSHYYDIQDVYFASKDAMVLIKLKRDITFNNVTRPISLLMGNELNWNLHLELKEGKEMKIVGYISSSDNQQKMIMALLSEITFCKTMNVSELTEERIQTKISHSDYQKGACLILNGKLAGISDYSSGYEMFQGNFSGIPFYYGWLTHIVGFENLKESFFQLYPEN